MIIGASITSTNAGVETMFVSGNATPEIFVAVSIFREELTVEDQLIYDNAISLVAPKYYNQIINTIAVLEINRITSTILADGEDVIDFELLSEADKNIFRDFLALVIELNNLQN